MRTLLFALLIALLAGCSTPTAPMLAAPTPQVPPAWTDEEAKYMYDMSIALKSLQMAHTLLGMHLPARNENVADVNKANAAMKDAEGKAFNVKNPSPRLAVVQVYARQAIEACNNAGLILALTWEYVEKDRAICDAAMDAFDIEYARVIVAVNAFVPTPMPTP